jgi:DNA-binding transcriptional LysR family regulator
MMNNISWRATRSFILVAEQGSFTKAADVSGFSKANLSQQVTELEASLSVQLLHRTTRKLRLTEVGEGYFKRAKQAMLALDSAGQWAMQSTQEVKGVIHMNAVGGPIGEELIAPIVMSFQREYPDVDVHLDFSSIRVDLIDGRYDLVVRMGELDDSTLVMQKLATIKTKYVASAEFVKQNLAIKSPDDLKKLPLIYGSVAAWTLVKGSESCYIQAQGIKVTSGRVMRKAALEGLGIARLADVYVQADIDAGRLVEILPDWSEQTSLSMLCPPHRYQLQRVKVLMQCLKEHFNDKYQQMLLTGL